MAARRAVARARNRRQDARRRRLRRHRPPHRATWRARSGCASSASTRRCRPPRRVWARRAHRTPAISDALLAEADVVTLHVPLDAATRHLIDAARLARMKRGAILVNTARGGVVDEAAVAAALRARAPGRRRARRVRAGAAAGRIAARRLPQPAADAAHRGRHRRIERARVDADRGEGRARRCAPFRRLNAGTRPAHRSVCPCPRSRSMRCTISPRARSSAPARMPAMAAATARALVYADAHGLASHGVSRVPQYATHLANGRADGAAHAGRRAREGRRGARRRTDAVSRFPRARSRSTRRSAARANSASRSRASPTAITSGSPRITSRPSAPRRHGRPRDGQLAGGHGRGRRAAAALRHQSDRRGVSAPERGRRSSSTCRCRKSRAAS